MVAWWWLLITLFGGFFAGVFFMGLMVATSWESEMPGGDSESMMERLKEKKHD